MKSSGLKPFHNKWRKNHEKESILKLITFMESNKMILQQFYAFLASITRLVSIVMKCYITQLCNTKFDKYFFLLKYFLDEKKNIFGIVFSSEATLLFTMSVRPSVRMATHKGNVIF